MKEYSKYLSTKKGLQKKRSYYQSRPRTLLGRISRWLLRTKTPLEPGTYEATLKEVKTLESGNTSVTLSQVKRR